MIHSRIPSLRAAATLALPNPLIDEHGLSGVGEHESGPKDGKLSARQKSASAPLHGCAREGKTKDSNR